MIEKEDAEGQEDAADQEEVHREGVERYVQFAGLYPNCKLSESMNHGV